ncbi:MAG: EAL domain-containing protein [Alphaproteobacteria bacterium]|nr:EAL domain-containing protein [Alphaproteobacteria bacterium]
MNATFHGLVALTYLAVSAAAAFALPKVLPQIEPDFAKFAAGGIFLVSALLHQAAVYALKTRRFTQELKGLKKANVALRAELTGLRKEIAASSDRPMMAADAISPEEARASSSDNSVVDDQIGQRELAMLRTLLAQLPRQEGKIAPANDEAGPEDDEIPLRLSGTDNGPLAATGAGAAPTARAATARRPVDSQSEYRRHLVTERGGLSPISEAIATSLSSDAAVLAATRDALERARVTLFVQPIVSLPNRRTQFYETYSRIRATDGELIGPERYLRVASEAGLIAAIDNNLLFRCIQLMRRLRKHERTYGFFCNVSPHTVEDNTFFPQFVDFLGKNGELSGNIIFEFTQPDIEAHYPAMADGLQRMAAHGYRFSLDRLTRFDVNFKALADRRFEYVKLDTRKILELRADAEGRRRIERMVRSAEDAGISLIIEKIETERELVELLDFPFAYGQGYLFGAPKESRIRD